LVEFLSDFFQEKEIPHLHSEIFMLQYVNLATSIGLNGMKQNQTTLTIYSL